MSARHPAWIATAVLAVAATVAFAFGTDDWKRSLREPTADAPYYYVYLPSLVLDGDLDFANQYQVTKNWYRLQPAPDGRAGNVFGIGPAMFALPVFVAAHGVARVVSERRDGFSELETTAVLWLSIPFTLGALVCAYRLARRRVAASAAYLGALCAALAGPLAYYAIRQPGYAHPCAAFFATWLIERWDASYDAPRTWRTWLVLGALAGAAALARPQLAVWWLLLPVAAIDDLRRESLKKLAPRLALGAAALAIVVLPQVVAWKLLYGAFYVVPQGPGFMRWDAPLWSETLFSSRNGLFAWSPLYAPMLIGVVILARRGARLPLALLLGLFAQAVVNGAAWDWWAGGSFGGRRFDSCYATFAVGAAVLIDRGMIVLRSRAWLARALVGLAFVVAILVTAAEVELAARTSVVSARITGGEPAPAVWVHRIGGVRGRLAAWLATAVTAPVRALFAWRNDESLDAYDRLVGVYALGETYPGLNSYPDKLHDEIRVDAGPPRVLGLAATSNAHARLVGDAADVLIGLNRRGSVTLKVQVETTGHVALAWNGDEVRAADVTGKATLELHVEPRRGINTLTIHAPVGALVSTIELIAP